MTDDLETALAPITQAQRALAEAITLDDFRALIAQGEGLRAWAEAIGKGEQAEAPISEFILRAERGAGKELVRMAEAGERASGGTFAGKRRGHGRHQPAERKPVDTLATLGIPRYRAQMYQRLARAWGDAQFEEKLAYVKTLGARIAKVDFYRGPKQAAKRDAEAVREAKQEKVSTGSFAAFEKAAADLLSEMHQLPNDELALVATYIRSLVERYNAVKAAR
jgi:hypothetical protein